MKLYEIDADIRKLYGLLTEGVVAFENADGEMEYINETLNKLNLERRKKLENIALLVEEIEVGAEKLLERSKTLTERAKSEKARANRLRDYIIGSMKAWGDKRVNGELCRLTVSERDKVIVDETLLPSEYWRKKPVVEEVDKVKIAADLRAGKAIEGARLEKNTSLQIK